MCEMCRDDSEHTYTWQDHLCAFRAAAEDETEVKEATGSSIIVGVIVAAVFVVVVEVVSWW